MLKLDSNFNWTGRVDDKDDPSCFRIHQCVEKVSLDKTPNDTSTNKTFSIIGFCSDEGVRRNLGRIGAKIGPNEIRKSLAPMAYPSSNPKIFDFGNIVCHGENLEQAQENLSQAVQEITKNGACSLVFGGGHETSLGHFLGLEKNYTDKKIGIINIDAHFDLRPPTPRGSSGSPFLQIAQHLEQKQKKFSYLCLGIQESANTQSLFNTATRLGVNWLTAEQMRKAGSDAVVSRINDFCKSCDLIYLTICLDAFSSAYAPGVSAPTPLGLSPYWAEDIIQTVYSNDKLIGADIVELNPSLDKDSQTAKLAASIVSKLLSCS